MWFNLRSSSSGSTTSEVSKTSFHVTYLNFFLKNLVIRDKHNDNKEIKGVNKDL